MSRSENCDEMKETTKETTKEDHDSCSTASSISGIYKNMKVGASHNGFALMSLPNGAENLCQMRAECLSHARSEQSFN